MKIQIIQTLPNGSVDKQILTKELNETLKVQVQPNTKLSIAVEGKKTVQTKRSGADLILEAEGEELVEVKDFYETPGASIGDVSWNFVATDGTASTEVITAVAPNSSTAALSASDDISVGGLFPISPIWMGSAAAAGAAAILLSAGGGAAAASIGSTVVNGSIILGPVTTTHSLIVELFRADGTLLTTATVDQTGTFTATFSASYTGPVLARVKDTSDIQKDYLDEATGTAKDLTTDIRAAFSTVGAGTISITLSPLSELAVRELVGDTGGDAGASGVVLGTLNTSALILAKNKEIAADFALAGTGTVPANVVTDFLVNPTVNQSGGSPLITANYAGYVLAALSGLDGIYGGTSGAIARLAGSTTTAQTNNLIALGAGQGVGLTAGLAASIGGDVLIAYNAAVASVSSQDATSLNASGPAGVAALAPLTISLLSTAQIGYITDLSLLSIEQLGALTAAQVGVLTASQIANLTGPQIAALILDVASLQTAQLNLLTVAQTQGLTANQLDALALTSITPSGADNVGTASTINPGDLTNDATLTFSGAFTGRIPPNAGIYIYLDGSSTPLSGTATVSGSTWSYTPSSAITGEGSHSVIAKLGVIGGNSATTATAAFEYELDTIAPTIGARAVPFSAAENQLAIGSVSATDTNGVAWSIDGGGADDSKFSINSTTGVLTFQSAKNYESPDDAGADRGYVVRVKATDSVGNSSTSDITVNLTDVNDAPVAASAAIALQTAVHNANFSLAMASYFTDADTGGLTGGTYSATGLGNGISINSSTGVISGLPTADATPVSVVVTFTDTGGLSATKSFNLQAVTAPTVSSFTVTDATGSSTVGKGGDALTFLLTMSEIVTITTTAPATAPTIEFTLNGTTATATYASGSGTSALTFTATAPATGNGTAISITGINLHSSTAIGSTSGQGWATSATGQTYSGYTVDNTAPTISTTSLNSNENGTAVGTVAGSDTNGITWSIDGTGSDDTKFNITAAGVLSFASVKNFESPDDTGGTAGDGTYVVKVKATDGAGNTTSSNVNVVLKNVNEAPVAAVPAIALQTAVHNVNFSLAMASYFSDIDSGGLTGGTYSATGLGNGISINSSTGVISGLPTADAAPTTIVVKFTDAGGLFITKSFSLQAVTAPTVSSFAVTDAVGSSAVVGSYLLGTGGDTLTFTLTMSEVVTIATTLPNTVPTIKFTLNGTDIVATYASGSGTTALVFTGTSPSTGDGSAISIKEILLNGSTATGSTTNQQWATSSVGQSHSAYTVDNTAPNLSASTIEVRENTASNSTKIFFDLNGEDVNGPVTYSNLGVLVGSGDHDSSDFTLSAAGVLTFKNIVNFESHQDYAADGTYDISFTVTDAVGLSSDLALELTIRDVNETPTYAGGMADKTVIYGHTYTSAAPLFDVSSYFSDPDSGTTLKYTATGLDDGLSININTGLITGTSYTIHSASNVVITAHDQHGSVNDLSVSATVQYQTASAPELSTYLSGVTDLDVRSKIVLRTTENLDLTQVGTFTITITNEANTAATPTRAAKAGYGESLDHTQTITITNGVVSGDGAITFVNGLVIIDPLYDLDISNNYTLAISDGAFEGTTTGLAAAAFTPITFSTVTPGLSTSIVVDDWCNTGFGVSGIANSSQIMSITTGRMLESGDWLDVTAAASHIRDYSDQSGVSNATIDSSSSDFVYVFRDRNVLVDNIEITDTAIKFANFNHKDLIYIDNQNQQVDSQQYVHDNVFSLGTGTFSDPWNVTLDGSSLATEIYVAVDAATRLLLPAVFTPLIHSFNSGSWSETGVVISA